MLAPVLSRTAGRRDPAPRLPGAAALLALAAWWALPAAARADNLDDALLRHADTILQELRGRGCRNVGVLKFQVQQGAARPSLHVGRLNTLMATRLENALILAEDEEDGVVGVTRGASAAAAARDPKATYLTRAGRRVLFEHPYPLAWGDKEVPVDAFLTGVVKVDAAGGKTTVRVEAFDRKDPDPRKVVEFTVPIERTVLADMNRRFALRKRVVDKKLDDKELNEAAAREFLEEETKGAAAPGAGLGDLLDFKIYYDGKRVPRDAADRIPSPRPGQRVHFVVKSKQRVGLVLRVNGINTSGYEKESREAADYSFWVLEPGEEYRIDGFYPARQKGKQDVLPFKVVDPTREAVPDLADQTKMGQIDIDVLLEGGAGAPEDRGVRPISLREAPAPTPTLKEQQGKLRVSASRKVRPRAIGGIIVGGGARKSAEILEVPFRGRWAAHLTIIYRRAPGTSGDT
jgi:hypothetical protein